MKTKARLLRALDGLRVRMARKRYPAWAINMISALFVQIWRKL